MGWQSGSKLLIALALGGCGGVPSEAIAPLPSSEQAEEHPTAETPGKVGSASPEPARAEAAPDVAGALELDSCRRFRVVPSWCNEAPKTRVRVRPRVDDGDGDGDADAVRADGSETR